MSAGATVPGLVLAGKISITSPGLSDEAEAISAHAVGQSMGRQAQLPALASLTKTSSGHFCRPKCTSPCRHRSFGDTNVYWRKRRAGLTLRGT